MDIRANARWVDAIQAAMRSTYGPRVPRHRPGGFAGLFRLDYDEALFRRNYERPVLVGCADGVGTKVKVATAFGSHSGIGRDIVAHCTNDILAIGARPVAFLDYVGFSRMGRPVFKQLISGIVRECRRYDIELIGGETAEMPGVYRDGEYDLVGCIIGVARRRNMLDGSKIREGR